MTFNEILSQTIEMLNQHGRVSYRALKRQFDLDDDYLADLRDELIDIQEVARDQDGRMLVWLGEAETAPETTPAAAASELICSTTTDPKRDPLSYTPPHLAEKILTSRSALEGERKQVTVLFCDLRNSTAIADTIGAEAMHGLLSHFFELAMDDVHRYEGTVNQLLGDGFMALFGAPIAHEDHARRAVLAALDLQRTLAQHHAELGGPHGVELAFRMGLNTGMVVVGSVGNDLRLDYTAIGDTTNLAARLEQIAEPGTILISESTSRLVQGYVRLEALEPVDVKGKTEPVSIYKIIGTLPRRSPVVSRGDRTLSEFVGRKRELDTLAELLAQVEMGQGQVVSIVAEAGQGKSRLLYEFRQRLAGKRVTYLEGRCLSYGRAIPYLPLLDLLRHNCGITEADDADAITIKVHDSLQEVDLETETWAPYLLHLFGVQTGTEVLAALSPEAVKARTFEMIRQMSLNGSRRQPLIFEVEDLHWIDTTSEAFFTLLAESLDAARILLLGTYRPGYRPPWFEQSYATQIALRQLRPDEGLAVIRSLAPVERLPDPLTQTILGKAEGNPFFLEELTRTILEHQDHSADLAVPDTVQGVLMARIDRLPDVSKRLLQTAAVLGRTFSLRLLRAIWAEPGGLESLLLELKRLEFVYEHIGAEEPTYVFKHALTQDVAYDSLLTTRRQALHSAAGAAFECLYAARLEEVYDRLAYHYGRTAEAEKAVEYLTRFAEKAAQGYAHVEAVTALQDALTHVGGLSAEEHNRRVLDLVLRLAHPFYLLGRFQDTLDLLLQEQERLDQLQDPALTGPWAFWLSHTYSYQGEHEQAEAYAHKAIAAAQSCGDEQTLGKAHYVLSKEGLWMCRFPQGIAHGQQAIHLLERTGEQWWLGHTYWIVGFSYYFMGEFNAALEAEAQAQTIGDMIGDLRIPHYAGWAQGTMQASLGNWQEAITLCQRSLDESRDPVNTAASLGFLGNAYLERGDATQALPLLEESVRQWSQFQYKPLHVWMASSWSDALFLDGQTDAAREVAHQAIALGQSVGMWYGVGMAQRVLGRLAQAAGDVVEAVPHFQDALNTFSSIQCRFEIGRTHLDQAALGHTQHDLNTATTHLNIAYSWFKKLQVPQWVERTEQLAQDYGVSLTEVELDEVEMEGSS